ncbi:SDR family mycofactocin-dependent oxidoreductase [Nocardioides cavernae]|nr:SDR family mycofactocin-dependent oxidoreductase [Nocardioides cavernae]
MVAVDSCAGENSEVSYALASRDDLDRVISDSSGAAVAFVADVRDLAALSRAVEVAVERWGRLDAAVAAAGVIAGGAPLWETDDRVVRHLWDVNVQGVWNTARAAVPVMLDGPSAGTARFVAVASAAGTFGLHRLAAYSASKHAVVGLVKGLAADLVGTGATACVVSPGSTATEMLAATARLYGMTDVQAFAANQLLGRVLDPEEVASAVAYCCGRDSVVNGSVIHADGGFAP